MTHPSQPFTYRSRRFLYLLCRSKLVCSLAAALALVFLCGVNARGQTTVEVSRALNVARVSAPLTNHERITATRLAEDALRSARLFTQRKMYLTESHIIRNTSQEMRGVFERRVMLNYYRYEGDLSIHVLIDLTRERVLEVKQRPRSFSPISTEESELAKQMALTNPQLSAALGPFRDRLSIEVLTLRLTLPGDPLFRHRVVHLLFRSGSTYLMRHSRVLVDLTAEKVIIEPAPGMPSM